MHTVYVHVLCALINDVHVLYIHVYKVHVHVHMYVLLKINCMLYCTNLPVHFV